MAIETEQVLQRVGFEKNEGLYVYNLETTDFTLSLSAAEGLNRHFAEVFSVDGVFSSSRAISEVHVELPLVCESYQQGLAILAFGLKSARQPLLHAQVGWFEKGTESQNLHPYFRDRKAADERYAQRPHCLVGRDWFRVARKKLLDRFEDDSNVPAYLEVAFDGRLLTFQGHEFELSVPAKGDPWMNTAKVSGHFLARFPKRFVHDPIIVDIWDNYLGIGGTRYHLTSC